MGSSNCASHFQRSKGIRDWWAVENEDCALHILLIELGCHYQSQLLGVITLLLPVISVLGMTTNMEWAAG